MDNKRRIYSAIAAALVILALIVSVLCLAVESDHECSGEDCYVCRILALCENTIKSFGTVFCVLCAALFLSEFSALSRTPVMPSQCIDSPVSLKVKLSN